MVNIKSEMSPGYLVLPAGGAVSGAGVCPKHVQVRRLRAVVIATPRPATAWQRVARTDFATLPSASSGWVT